MGFKMRNQGLPGINSGNSKKTDGRASSAPFQQRKKRSENKKTTEVDYNSAPILQPRSTSSSSRNVVDRMYNSGAVDGGPTQGLDSKLTFNNGTGNYTRTEVTSSPAFEQRDTNPKLIPPTKLDMQIPQVNRIPTLTRDVKMIPWEKYQSKQIPNTSQTGGYNRPRVVLPDALQFGGKDTGEKPSGLPQKSDSILYGTKETHNGVDTYKTLKEVRDNINRERQSLISNGATDKEIKNFDTYQNKRISELYKRG